MAVSSLSLFSFKLLDIFLALTSLFCRVNIYPHSYLTVGLYLFLFYISIRDCFSFSQSTALIFILVHVCGWWVVSFPFALKVFILLWRSKSVFVGYRIPCWWLFAFQHFTDASPWSSDFLVLGKSALSVVVPFKATPFFLWALEPFFSALGTRRAAETNVWFSFLSHWSDSWTNSLSVSSVAQCLAPCIPTDCSMPGFPVHHQLLELAQAHVHWIGDAIQPSHHLSSSSSPAFNLSQHQGLFQWVSSPHQVAKVLELQLQHQSFQWIFRTDFL